MKYLIRNLKYVDLFEKPVKLFVKKEEGHKTMFGAFMSMGIISIILILLINSLITLFQRQNPTSLQTDQFLSAPPQYILSPQNFTFQMGVEYSNYSTYIDESIIIINATYRRLLTVKQNDGSFKQVNMDQQIPLARCNGTGVIRQKNLYNFFNSYDGYTNLCVDWNKIDQLSIQGKFGNANYEFLEFTINICSNETRRPDGPACRDRASILEILQQNYLSFQLSNNILDLKNLHNPFSQQGLDKFTTMSGSISKEIQLQMQPVTVVTDDGFIQSTGLTESTIRFSQMAEFLDVTNAGQDRIALISIILTQYESLNYRSYPKLQEMLGQIGGLWNVLFTVARLLQMPISTISYQLLVINSLFNFEKKEGNFDSTQTPIKPKNPKGREFNRSNQKKSIHLTRKLDSILDKHQQLEGLQLNNQDERLKLGKQIQDAIKDFFQNVSNKLRLTCVEYASLFYVTSQKYRREQFTFSVSRMEKSLDILYIIKKLQEVDKLKAILLNRDQLKLFDYLPKPTIGVDIKDTSHEKHQNQYFSILKRHKTNYQSAIEAQKAFQKLQTRISDPINEKLVSCLDEDIVKLLKMQLVTNTTKNGNQQVPLNYNSTQQNIEGNQHNEVRSDEDDALSIKINQMPCFIAGQSSRYKNQY